LYILTLQPSVKQPTFNYPTGHSTTQPQYRGYVAATDRAKLGPQMSKFSEFVLLSSITPFNVGLSSATQETMISLLGRPKLPLTTQDQPDHVSDTVRKLQTRANVADTIRVTGIKPAVKSLRDVLSKAAAENPQLVAALSSAGMLVVRLRRPTSGNPSTKISNHSWGTAIDFAIDGKDPVGDTGQKVPRGIAMLVPFFNAAGWFSGIAFHDDMHFEVAEETIRKWAQDGDLDT
jgi:hypothetical protein